MGVTADYVIEADISEFKGVTRETNPNETQRETKKEKTRWAEEQRWRGREKHERTKRQWAVEWPLAAEHVRGWNQEGGVGRKNIWGSNVWKDSKCGENCNMSTDPRNSVNPKQKKYEENDTIALHNPTP